MTELCMRKSFAAGCESENADHVAPKDREACGAFARQRARYQGVALRDLIRVCLSPSP
jgi:hypothetical protein